ncbi:MAG: hypothetical protein JWQ39_3 [Glaciihabitans sp.]|nr:hypothetical protein [Glaciihabitans sp.]
MRPEGAPEAWRSDYPERTDCHVTPGDGEAAAASGDARPTKSGDAQPAESSSSPLRAEPQGEDTRGGPSTGHHSTSAAFRCLRGLGTSRRGRVRFLQQETWGNPANALSLGVSGATFVPPRAVRGVVRCPQCRGQPAHARDPRSGVILEPILEPALRCCYVVGHARCCRLNFGPWSLKLVGPATTVPPAEHPCARRVSVPTTRNIRLNCERHDSSWTALPRGVRVRQLPAARLSDYAVVLILEDRTIGCCTPLLVPCAHFGAKQFATRRACRLASSARAGTCDRTRRSTHCPDIRRGRRRGPRCQSAGGGTRPGRR